jgi:hypothetical protein
VEQNGLTYLAVIPGKTRGWRIKCRCSCGKIFTGPESLVRRLRSCGCRQHQIEDLTGQTFGHALVLGPAARTHHEIRWLCRCDCGTEFATAGTRLKSGKTGSCGCHRYDNVRLLQGQADLNDEVQRYRNNARRRGLEFTLSHDEATALLTSPCSYCGALPRARKSQRARFGRARVTGIDRRDNTQGYTHENSVSCCQTCNFAKSNQSAEEFLAWIDRLLTHRKTRQSATAGESHAGLTESPTH